MCFEVYVLLRWRVEACFQNFEMKSNFYDQLKDHNKPIIPVPTRSSRHLERCESIGLVQQRRQQQPEMRGGQSIQRHQ